MKAKERGRTILIFFVSILVIAAALEIYMRVIWETVQENTVETMREIAAHDKKSVEGENQYSWELLQQIFERVRQSQPSDVEDVIDRLNLESTVSYYEGVYLVDDTGTCYSHTGSVLDGTGTEPVERILDGEENFALNFRTGTSMERYRDYLVYGSSFSPYTVGDVRYVGAYVLAKVHSMENRMKLDSFSGEGLTSVFDSDGDYVIRKDQKVNIAKRQNYYDQLQKQYTCTDAQLQEVKAKIEQREPFKQEFTTKDGANVIACYEFIDGIDWTMTLEVPQSAINTSVKRFVWLMLAVLIFVAAVIVTLTMLIVRFQKNTVRAQAETAAQSQFLANMSHEIRTPLNGIIGLNHLMTLHLNDRDKLQEYLEKSSNAEHYLLELINDILDVQKLQAGKMELVDDAFSVEQMLGTLQVIMQERVQENQLSFTIKKEIVCDALIGDATRIQQILINILGNAAKFTDAGGRIEFQIRQLQEADERVTTVYEIADNGCGMTPEFCRHIFEPFSQERMAQRETSVHGTGLGMNISYELARKMGGDLSVTSQLGVGSCFTFQVTNRRAASSAADAAPENSEAAAGKALHILIAEDNELNAEILSELLRNAGCRADVAVDGEEAVRMFAESEEFTYDLILMDMQMPKKNGCQAASTIRSLNRRDAAKVRIFACTANTFREDVQMAKEAGMDDFIAKPIDVPKLFEKLNRFREN